MRLALEVVVRRGEIAESRHRIQAALVDSRGRLVLATSDPHRVTTFRSAAKPIQLLPLVERGHAERWQWSDEHLAVMASSHTGSAHHIALVHEILGRLGLTGAALACGYHEPIDPDSRALLAGHPEERSPLYNNCSGKHAGMLCLALSEGWPAEGYEHPEHPVQQLMRRTVAELGGLEPPEVAVAVDGCSVSVFGLPLSSMARAYARLGAARAEGDDRERALARIRRAMQVFPRVAGGVGRFSTALMEAVSSRLVVKGGAEGLECVSLPETCQGLAVKCEDGQDRAVGPAVVAVLEHLGRLSEEELGRLGHWRRPRLQNHAGLHVGFLEANIEALSPAVS
jgi:L-asparaginase II